MKIGICTIAYNQPLGLQKMVKSATADADPEFHIFVHSTSQQIQDVCSGIDRAIIHNYKFNRGVARSWNDGIISMITSHCNVMLVVNDDIVFGQGDLSTLVSAAINNQDKWAVFCHGHQNGKYTSLGMACFAINRIAINRIGAFDENFFPAYNEDMDYIYRAERLAGLKRVRIDTTITHIGSASIKTSKQLKLQNDETHKRNNEYYKRKWGGPVRGEIFKRPFANRNFHPYFIPMHGGRKPYPGFNRDDQHIVRL